MGSAVAVRTHWGLAAIREAVKEAVNTRCTNVCCPDDRAVQHSPGHSLATYRPPEKDMPHGLRENFQNSLLTLHHSQIRWHQSSPPPCPPPNPQSRRYLGWELEGPLFAFLTPIRGGLVGHLLASRSALKRTMPIMTSRRARASTRQFCTVFLSLSRTWDCSSLGPKTSISSSACYSPQIRRCF